MYLQFAAVFPGLILFHQKYIFLAPDFPPGPWGPGFLEACLANKD